ncbi:MAG: hypothetical protein HZA68_10250 [Rhodovulum sp.]|nr:hypothetical protein [Rhodovulum sp.]
MKRVEFLGLAATEEERQNFRVSLLEARVRELEHIVHALLRDRVDEEQANAWLEVCENQNTFTPMVKAIEGRGKQIANNLDRWPGDQKWAAKE